MRENCFRLFFALLLVGLAATMLVQAQTMTTGDVAGVVTDTSGAVVPNAAVIVKDMETGEVRTVASGPSGAYRLTFLKPSTYQITANVPGLKSDIGQIVVSVGQVQTVDLVLKIEAATETIMVTDAVPLLQTENANLASTFSTKEIEMLPMPGGDITSVAFTVPGVAVSTGGGYGNFSSHGLPGTSNLYTLNGNDNMDPYLNLNNSGASNLTLGANEIDQASVVQNAYSAQYGRQAGAQVSFITKSGTNQFHGNLVYNYNGSVMNANDFFANASGTPRGRAISNQYAASIGGPIRRDKLFFFVDTEGLRYVLPTTGVVSVPSQAFENYVLGTVPAAQQPFYQQMFNLYNSAPGANRAVPVTNGDGSLQDSYGGLGCGLLAGTSTQGGILGQNISCANAFGTNVVNQNSEWLMKSQVHNNINQNQNIFFRFKTDHGLQPTYTSAISPVFNAISNQPSYEGQVTHNWVISPRLVNHFIGSSSWYSAIFSPTNLNASLAAFPEQILIYDGGANGTGGLTQMGLSNDTYPQGRRVGQLQLTDDLSYNRGSHWFKFGLNYRYNRITDTGNQRLVNGGRYILYGLDEFASGAINPASGSQFAQRVTPYPVVHLRLYNVGFYAQDEWAARRDLKLTLALRIDRTGNPSCTDHCFARLVSPFETLQKGADIPYNQSIQTGLDNAFYSIEPVVVQPRFGIVYNPSWSKGTVIRGGIGLFPDLFPGFIASGIFGNSPNVFTPAVRTGTIDSGGAGSAPAIAIATGQTFMTGFANGYTRDQMRQALAPVAFTEPGYTTIPQEMINPKYLEWNFEIQHEVGPKNVFTLSYVGNKGYDIFMRNLKVNAWANTANYYPNGFGGLPTAAPDPRFRIVTEINNNGYSNYNGLSFSYRRALGYGFQGQFAYTWSHALDTLSNGGLTLYYSGDSFTNQFDPYSVRALNYSNADYDIRHNVTAEFSWEVPAKFQSRLLDNALGGWTLASKWYARTGTPFSVYNSRIPGRVSVAFGGNVLADLLDPHVNTSCGNVNVACFDTSQFAGTSAQLDYGNLPRNAFRGPGYFNTDFTLFKTFRFGERAHFTLGASAYNLFNHPNFASPGQDVATSGLGLITSTVSAPTSPYGSFQGSAVSGRVMVVTGRFAF